MTFRHRAGVRPYASPRGFAESCVFGKQSFGPLRCGRPGLGWQAPPPGAGTPSPEVTGQFCRVPLPWFSRSPRYVLPAHLCRFAVRAPGGSLGAFLGSMGSPASTRSSSGASGLVAPAFHKVPPYAPSRGRPEPRPATLLRHPVAQAPSGRCGNVCPLCIGYALRPRLSSRLTRGRLASPRKPWAYGGGVSHAALATHASILTSGRSTRGRPLASPRAGKLPYQRSLVPPLRCRA